MHSVRLEVNLDIAKSDISPEKVADIIKEVIKDAGLRYITVQSILVDRKPR